MENQENTKYLPGVKLSKNINPEPNINKAVAQADVIFITVPSNCVRSVVQEAAPYISSRAICIDVSKGMEEKSFVLITGVLKKLLPKNKIATISGPAIAAQMVREQFTAMNVASTDASAIRVVKKVMENKNLKLIATNDVVGVEVGGSFKNVYAIAIGVCDGLKIATNTKAVLFTVALQEISLLVKKMGGRVETAYGLVGLGDLIGTGLANGSRNRKLGEFMAQGLSLNKALAKVGQVVEGVAAAKVLRVLSKKYKLKTPLADAVYKILYSQTPAQKIMENFLQNLK